MATALGAPHLSQALHPRPATVGGPDSLQTAALQPCGQAASRVTLHWPGQQGGGLIGMCFKCYFVSKLCTNIPGVLPSGEQAPLSAAPGMSLWSEVGDRAQASSALFRTAWGWDSHRLLVGTGVSGSWS